MASEKAEITGWFDVRKLFLFYIIIFTQFWALNYFWGAFMLPVSFYLLYYVVFCIIHPIQAHSKREPVWEKIVTYKKIDYHSEITRNISKKNIFIKYVLNIYILVNFLQIDFDILNDFYIFNIHLGDFKPVDKELSEVFFSFLYALPFICINGSVFEEGCYKAK